MLAARDAASPPLVGDARPSTDENRRATAALTPPWPSVASGENEDEEEGDDDDDDEVKEAPKEGRRDGRWRERAAVGGVVVPPRRRRRCSGVMRPKRRGSLASRTHT